MKRDYYAILGLSKKAPAKQVERAYLKLARRLHPDLNPGDKKAAAEFRRVQEAYRTLSDPGTRRNYDRTGSRSPRGGEKTGKGDRAPLRGDLRAWENIFRDIFHEGGPHEAESAAARGEDIHQVLEVSFEESLTRTRRQVVYQREVTCSRCGGGRHEPGANILACPDCGGSGLVSLQRGPYRAQRLCHRCEGSGETGDPPCRSCHGKGRVLKSEKKSVSISPGSDSGTRIVVAGGGQPGKGGGEKGDLVVTVRVASHAVLERRGYNLYTSIPVTVAEAAMGTTVLVAAVGEKIPLKIPPGTQAGQQFRLGGRGVPRQGGKGGDLYVTVTVVIPAAKDGRARRLFREMEKMFPENPRVRG